MPVPVPRIDRPPAHPVIKQPRRASVDQVISLQCLSQTLPVSPTCPPPSFGTREQWINSLPSWRRTKHRRIWEDDSLVPNVGYIDQDNLIVTSDPLNTRAFTRADISPIQVLCQSRGSSSPFDLDSTGLGDTDEDADDEMSSDCSIADHLRYEAQAHCAPRYGSTHIGDSSIGRTAATPDLADGGLYNVPCYERGAFTPVFEEDSTPLEITSSPLEPLTPFGQFVDRAVAAIQQHSPPALQQADCGYTQAPEPRSYEYQQPQSHRQKMAPVPPVELIPTPSANEAYRKLAQPLATWIADYVWKSCTTGMNLQPAFCQSNFPAKLYPASPPDQLASSVHSLLLSTLLQPSAVFLGLWYIIRLPVFFDSISLSADYIRENRFRVALLGQFFEDSSGKDRMEADAPFRLIVLGMMLANKWLDDHTFSNKTWHSISNVPIQLLNRLEYLSLDIFFHDLSISPDNWNRWLAHVMSYHLSLSSQCHPQPISRPSTNPYYIVRKTIEELTQAPAAWSPASSTQGPTFLGLEERRKDKLEKERSTEVLAFDLDEDGPLPYEYLPKRRVAVEQSYAVKSKLTRTDSTLPPPAKWSPAGDEPILRDSKRTGASYLVVRSSFDRALPAVQSRRHILHVDPHPGGQYLSKNASGGYGYDSSSHRLEHFEVAHKAYPYMLHLPPFHAQSFPHTWDADDSHIQSKFEYSCSDIRMTIDDPKYQDYHDACRAHDHTHGTWYGNRRATLPSHHSWLRVQPMG